MGYIAGDLGAQAPDMKVYLWMGDETPHVFIDVVMAKASYLCLWQPHLYYIIRRNSIVRGVLCAMSCAQWRLCWMSPD